MTIRADSHTRTRLGALVLTCLLFNVLATGCSASAPGNQAPANARAHLEAAGRALNGVGDVGDQLANLDPVWESRTLPALAERLESIAASATQELEAAAPAVERMEDGNAKQAYREALDSYRKALAEVRVAAPLAHDLPALNAAASAADTALSASRSQVNTAVKDSNKGRYRQALADAKKAAASVDKGITKLKTLEKLFKAEPTFGGQNELGFAFEAAQARRDVAQAAIDVAQAGIANSESRYTAATKKYRAALDRTDSLTTQEIIGEEWFKAGVATSVATARGEVKAGLESFARGVKAAEQSK